MMLDMTNLSPRQRNMLHMIREFIDENGYPPSFRQIGDAVGISSTSVVSYNLRILQRKGLIAQDKDVSRGLRLVEDETYEMEAPAVPSQPLLPTVPLLGTIAAGQPIPIPDSDLVPSECEQIALPLDIKGDLANVYALKVRGNSMIDALINDGDIVVMRHQLTAENGEMVAAWIKDERSTTLKRFYWETKTLVRLQPANPTMDPIYVHPSNLEIQGKVIGVIRWLN